ncbi:uncharacterized protein RCO7_14226 [Rhynchosporium graminicola]|uniref:Uncharacterized protein n=1 Tax=Rhynchosporium graminicola TaxID=2792576 RepID=A0A1E1K0H0_9HELO|nr:uncharacterized protein RCO7_14226 [Rhynchosporium commune]
MASPSSIPDDGFVQIFEAPAGSNWYSGVNALASNSTTPFFIAKDYRLKHPNNQTGGYKVIQPFVTTIQSAGNFTLSTITIERSAVDDVSESIYPGHADFEVLDG